MDYVFTREELHVLDSVIPPFRRKKQEPHVEVNIVDILLQKKKCIYSNCFFAQVCIQIAHQWERTELLGYSQKQLESQHQ